MLENMKFSEAQNTFFDHIIMPSSSVIKFICSKVKRGGGGLYLHPVFYTLYMFESFQHIN